MDEFFLMPEPLVPAFLPTDADVVEAGTLQINEPFEAMFTGRHVVTDVRYPNVIARDGEGKEVTFGHRAPVKRVLAAEAGEGVWAAA